MYEHIHAFVQTAAEAFKPRGPVYEFTYCPGVDPGRGATLRDCFPETGYIGCELGDAARIDRLASLDRLPFPDGAAQTVICTGALEHVFEPRRVVDEMARILAPGGVLLLSAQVESSPSTGIDNYWRLTPHSVQRLLGSLEATLVAWQGHEQSPHTVYGIGCKGSPDGPFIRGLHRLMEAFPQRLERLEAEAGWRWRLRRLLVGWAQDKYHRRRLRDFYKVQFVAHLPTAAPLSQALLSGGPSEEPTGTRLDLGQ